MGARIGMRGPFDLLPLARVRCRLPLGGYRLRSNALRGFAQIHRQRHSWPTRMRGSDGRSAFNPPSTLSGVHPLRRASMTHASSGEYAMRPGFRGWRARCSALRCAVIAEWNGLDVHAPAFKRFGR